MRWCRKRLSTRLTSLSTEPAVFEPEPEPEWRVGSLRSLAVSDSEFQRVVDENAEAAAREDRLQSENRRSCPARGRKMAVRECARVSNAGQDENKVSPFRHISDVVRGLYGRIQSGTSGESDESNPGTASKESHRADSANDDARGNK